MLFTTDYKLEKFILETRWEDIDNDVKERMQGCFVDLLGALIAGGNSKQFEVGLKLAKTLYGVGDIPVIGSDEKFNFFGAATAMGHSSNAYDIDDGHNITRAHPGTSFVGAVLAAAYEKNLTVGEFLAAMLVAYETTIRSGAAIMDYYKFAHSSGTFGAVGVVAGVGRIFGFTKEEMNNALSVAEFNAPLVPGIRSVEYPSMNKDGVPFGVMTGLLALYETMCGFTGNKNLLEAEEYNHYLDDLGEKYHVMDLYFKPYPCCRWAHPAIDACIELMKEESLKGDDVAKVFVRTFERATMLSKIEPKTTDEAQYNIAYPVAAAVVRGNFGIREVMEDSLNNAEILDMMKKITFEVDEEFDKAFPAKRYCSVKIQTNDGKIHESRVFEPRGEAHEKVGFDWLCDKFFHITSPFITKECQKKITEFVKKDDVKIREIVDFINKSENRK